MGLIREIISLLILAFLAFPFLDGSLKAARAQTVTPLPTPIVTNYTFVIQTITINTNVSCGSQEVLAVNGQIPGPEIRVQGNQSVIVNVTNDGPYGITIHWHGVKQPRNPWADGPEYITQCPILPGETFIYNITLSDEIGTIWWHAHSDWSRLTVYGAFVILPPGDGTTIVSPDGLKVDGDHTLIFGSWYDLNTTQLKLQSDTLVQSGVISEPASGRYTINGLPGDQFFCGRSTSTDDPIFDSYEITVRSGETHLLRLVNAAMLEGQFFRVIDHDLTVIARDGALVEPFTSSYVVIFPGETLDVRFVANKNPGKYYMAFSNYPNGNVMTTGFVSYNGFQTTPILSPFIGNATVATEFINQLKSKDDRSNVVPQLDANVSRYTIWANQQGVVCEDTPFCNGTTGDTTFAHLNFVSFVPNTTDTILGALYHERRGVYDPTFPTERLGSFTRVPNKVMNVSYKEAVEIVFQSTGGAPFHPMHLHGYSFFLVGMGVGTFSPTNETIESYNLINPPEVNTATVLSGGWAAVRLNATNPGVWFMHCHIETHVSRGMATAMIVHNGIGTEEGQQMIPPPGGQWPACAH